MKVQKNILEIKDYKKDFIDTFTTLTRFQDANIIFDDCLNYCLTSFVKGGFKWTSHKYDEDTIKLFYRLLEDWILIVNTELKKETNNGFYDWWGVFYENYILSQFKAGTKGQFFTPMNVCKLMAEITMTGYYEDHSKDKRCSIHDSCCGSGRLLLAANSLRQGNYLIGCDLDRQAVLMCVLNMVIHGCVGVVSLKNSLTNEFTYGFQVNQYLNLLGEITVQKCDNEDKLYNFIGLRELLSKDTVIIENDESVIQEENIENKLDKMTSQSNITLDDYF